MSESEKEKIKQWLSDECLFHVKEEQKPGTSFFLRIDNKQTPNLTIPLFIFAPEDEKTDIIIVFWKWSLLPEYRQSLLRSR